MTLTATQRAVLDAARARPDRRLEPLPEGLKGGAAKKVVDALIARGLAEPGPDGPVAAPERPQEGETPAAADDANGSGTPADGPLPRVRPGTKQARMIELLRREGGATVDEIRAETGWAAHTVRGAMSGALKKRLGLDVRSKATEDRGRVYRIVG